MTMWNGVSQSRGTLLLQHNGLAIEVIAEGAGPLVVMLPSARRGQEDFGVVAAGIAAAGFRVLRPEPRGIGRSSKGPVQGITYHDFADDVAAVIRSQDAGPAI